MGLFRYSKMIKSLHIAHFWVFEGKEYVMNEERQLFGYCDHVENGH